MNRKSSFILLLAIASLVLFAIRSVAADATAAKCYALTPTPTPAATDEVSEHPTPLVILTEFDPWNMVLGSDSPSFVLYDDGLVIYQRMNDDGDWEFASVQLSDDERDTLFAELVPSPEAFFTLESYYDTVMITDQPTSTITIYDPEHGEYSVSVYGGVGSSEDARELTPDPFLVSYDAIVAYENDEVETWLPDYFEVIIWEYDYSDPVEWLPDFPGLDDPMTVQRDSVYSLYLPVEALERYLELTEDASALLIDGETWAFSLRYPFPHEYTIP